MHRNNILGDVHLLILLKLINEVARETTYDVTLLAYFSFSITEQGFVQCV